MFHVPEKSRLTKGLLGSDSNYGNNGFFVLSNPYALGNKAILRCQASDGEGWEHVSVSIEFRCPTCDEMCYIKNIFWDESDCVMQLHPPKSEWVNNYKFCLHLWRPIDCEISLPNSLLVGWKELKPEDFMIEK